MPYFIFTSCQQANTTLCKYQNALSLVNRYMQYAPMQARALCDTLALAALHTLDFDIGIVTGYLFSKFCVS